VNKTFQERKQKTKNTRPQGAHPQNAQAEQQCSGSQAKEADQRHRPTQNSNSSQTHTGSKQPDAHQQESHVHAESRNDSFYSKYQSKNEF